MANECRWMFAHLSGLSNSLLGLGEMNPMANNNTSKYNLVYAIHGLITNTIKIGTTTVIEGRFASLQSSNGEPIQVIACWLGNEENERAFHALVRTERLHREWFAPSARLMAFIAAHNESQPTGDRNIIALPLADGQSLKIRRSTVNAEEWQRKMHKALGVQDHGLSTAPFRISAPVNQKQPLVTDQSPIDLLDPTSDPRLWRAIALCCIALLTISFMALMDTASTPWLSAVYARSAGALSALATSLGIYFVYRDYWRAAG